MFVLYGSYYTVGETGVKRDTGSKGTVGGKIVDINKINKNFSMLFQYVYFFWHEIWLSFVNNCMSY